MDYKKYSLEKLQEWVHDALSTSEASPHEIYSTIREAVREDYYCYKHHASRAYGLLALLNGERPVKDESVKEKRDAWEEHYYPEEVKSLGELWDKEDAEAILRETDPDSCMTPWDHSDMETLRYTDEELDAMCDAAKDKEKCREYNLREAEYYNKSAELDAKKDKPKKWVLPVEEVKDEDTDENIYCVTFPDDLLEAANLKEGDQIEWIDQGDGSYLLKKVQKEMTYDEAIAAGWTMTADGFWIREHD